MQDMTWLEPQEMAALAGGDLGDGGSSFAKDLGYALGAVCGFFAAIVNSAPESSYSYAKVGY